MHLIILHVIALSDFFVIFVKIILFTVKLAPYHPSTHYISDFFVDRLVEVFGPSYALCHYTQRVFVIFAKLVVFVVSLIFIAVSLRCNQQFFLGNFRQNGCFRCFCWGLSTLSCLMPLHPAIFFGNLCRNCNFCQNSCFRRFHWLPKVELSLAILMPLHTTIFS